jgi:hypothetical protein
MANETTNLTNAVFIPELWANETQMFAKSKLVLAPRVKRLDSQVKGKGDVIHIPKVSEISTTAKSRGVDVVPSAATESEFTLTVNQHFYAAKDIEDFAKIQSAYDLRSIYTEALGYGIAKKIDTAIGALASGFSQIVGAGGTALTDANLTRAIQYLDDADAPESDRHFVVRPSVKRDLLQLDKFVLLQNVTGDRVNTGKIGEVYGIEVAISTNISITDASPDVNNNMMFHKEAIACAIQSAPRVQAEYELRGLSTLLVVDTIYGVAEYRDTFGVWFKS